MNPQPDTASSFSDFLRMFRSGVVHDDVTQLLDELVDVVGRVKKKGTLTITVTVEPGAGDMLDVDVYATAKPPRIPDPRGFWTNLNGKLTMRHPLQPSLDEHAGTMHVGPGDAD